jgi:ABC-type polysaccharide/polyol phosphate export permease
MTEFDIGLSDSPDRGPMPKPPTMAQHLRLARRDVSVGLTDWRVWLLLGMNDVRQRYRRSRLGQFWITLAMAIQIGSLGFLYSYLFHLPVAEYLPYLGTSFVIWGLLSSVILEACSVFIAAEGYLRQVPMPKSIYVHRMLVRNVVTFLHNLVIIPPLYLFFHVPISATQLLALAGILVLLLNGIWVGLFLGTLCARFRDMPQIMVSLVQIAFYLTPVMYRRVQLPSKWQGLFALNPFQSFLDIVREPMLGSPPPLIAWEISGLITVVGFAVTAVFFSRFRARIVYWL